jgi:hypothetical protein
MSTVLHNPSSLKKGENHMATTATITLERLRCIRESEGGSEPYIWPVLLWIDNKTLDTDEDVGITTSLLLGNARVVLKSGMRAGETAPIPFPLGNLGVGFEDDDPMRLLMLIVGLLENDETPEIAMWEGCKAFLSALPDAIADKLPELYRDIRTRDEVGLKQTIEDIKEHVGGSAVRATFNALTPEQKISWFFGALNLDDIVGAGYIFSGLVGTTFSLSISADDQKQTPTMSATQHGLLGRMCPQVLSPCLARRSPQYPGARDSRCLPPLQRRRMHGGWGPPKRPYGTLGERF